MNLEEKTLQAIERMIEYYDKEELSYFIKYCTQYKLPYEKSILFLDGQTRADYWICNGRYKPFIPDYMERAKQYFGGKDNE